MTEEEFKKKVGLISFDHRQSNPTDDDAYQMAQSPFDDKWYVFSAGKVLYVEDSRPPWFDQDF